MYVLELTGGQMYGFGPGGGDIDDGQGALVHTYTRYLVQNVEKLGRWMTHQFRYWTFLNH